MICTVFSVGFFLGGYVSLGLLHSLVCLCKKGTAWSKIFDTVLGTCVVYTLTCDNLVASDSESVYSENNRHGCYSVIFASSCVPPPVHITRCSLSKPLSSSIHHAATSAPPTSVKVLSLTLFFCFLFQAKLFIAGSNSSSIREAVSMSKFKTEIWVTCSFS